MPPDADWKADPTAHEYREETDPWYKGYCGICGQEKKAHTGANLPVDQQLRALGPERAPRLL